jgi:hypothetical protein
MGCPLVWRRPGALSLPIRMADESPDRLVPLLSTFDRVSIVAGESENDWLSGREVANRM